MKSAIHRSVVAVVAAFGVNVAAVAATNLISSAAARFEVDRAMCLRGQTGQDRSDCLREAAAAYEQAKREGVHEDASQFAANRVHRCEPLPEQDRRDCIARMQGKGTISGSVEGGGIYRELVTEDPQ
jgi:hypothetical protein